MPIIRGASIVTMASLPPSADHVPQADPEVTAVLSTGW